MYLLIEREGKLVLELEQKTSSELEKMYNPMTKTQGIGHLVTAFSNCEFNFFKE